MAVVGKDKEIILLFEAVRFVLQVTGMRNMLRYKLLAAQSIASMNETWTFGSIVSVPVRRNQDSGENHPLVLSWHSPFWNSTLLIRCISCTHWNLDERGKLEISAPRPLGLFYFPVSLKRNGIDTQTATGPFCMTAGVNIHCIAASLAA